MNKPSLPWRALVAVALLSTSVAVLVTLIELSMTSETNGWLVHTGPGGPAAQLMSRDFPEEPQFARGEHDGPMFYAIAQHPADLDEASRYLDRPQYRLQRPLYPWLARLAYPPGQGVPMVWTMFGVGTVGVFLGAFSLGAISWMLGGRPGIGLLVGLLPGTLMSLRISAADTLCLGLLLGAIALSLRGRHLPAAVAAVAAVLTKEIALVSLAGFALWRRDRHAWEIAGVPAVIAVLWGLYLRTAVPVGQGSLLDVTVPFGGLIDSVRLWMQGDNLLTLVCVPAGIVIAIAGSIRAGWRHPLTFAVLANLSFLVIFNLDVVGLDRNGTRTVMPLLALASVQILTANTAQSRVVRSRRQDPARAEPARGAQDRCRTLRHALRSHGPASRR